MKPIKMFMDKRLRMCLFILSVLFIIGCSQQTETSTDDGSNVKEITITAKQWEFDPNPIEVNLGDTVRLKIKSIDVAHGFKLTEFGINERLEPDKEVAVEFVADKAGEFSFFCNVPCGSGHSAMTGTLIVN